MTWRTFLIDWPARIVDAAWFGYWLCIAAGSIVAITSALLWLALGLAGYPLP